MPYPKRHGCMARYAEGCRCDECVKALETRRMYDRELKRKSRRSAPEKYRAIDNRWYARHRKLKLARVKAWTTRNQERVRESRRAWRELNQRRVKASRVAYSRRSATAAGYASADQIEARVEYYGDACAYCGGPFEHVDHVIALSRGGSNWPANLRPACRSCNSRKRNRALSDFLAELQGGSQ